MQSIIQDIRFALRMFARRPGLTITALVCLSLGIGATVSVYSVVSAVLLRPYPYREPSQLCLLLAGKKKEGYNPSQSVPDFQDWRKQNHTLQDLALFTVKPVSLTGPGEPERVDALHISHSLFSLLGVRPLLGREFREEETKAGSHRVAILTYSLWQRRYDGDPKIVGKALSMDSTPYTIVGVLPEDFYFPMKAEIVFPQVLDSPFTPRGANAFFLLARLKPKVTPEKAEADLTVIMHRFPKEHYLSGGEFGCLLRPFSMLFVREVRIPLLILFGTVVFVLLIACINVANLLLVLGVERRQEITMRAALGARRSRIVRQVLTENLMLTLAASALGLLLALWGVDLVSAILPRDYYVDFGKVSIDQNVLAFTLLATVLTGLLCGIAPALQASRLDLQRSLQEGGTRATTGWRGRWVRNGLVVAEVALTLVLVAAAGLMTRSFGKLLAHSPGFNAESVLTVGLEVSFMDSLSGKAGAFFTAVEKRVKGLPGVESTGLVSFLPLTSENWTWNYRIVGEPPQPPPGPSATSYLADGDYFRAMQIPLLKGRLFQATDTKESPRVAVISAAMARKHWPSGNAIGKRLQFGEKDPPTEIVGIVGDVNKESLSEATPMPAIYLPYSQITFGLGSGKMRLVVRTKDDPLALLGAVRREVHELNKDMPLDGVDTLKGIIGKRLVTRKILVALSIALAAMAFVLALAGVYGVMTYTVAQRSHEIGIRAALGAERRDIMRLVLSQGLRLTGAGVALGVLAALGAGRSLASQLYGVSPNDPLTLGGVSMLLVGVAMVACYVPARRATRIEPMRALRHE